MSVTESTRQQDSSLVRSDGATSPPQLMTDGSQWTRRIVASTCLSLALLIVVVVTRLPWVDAINVGLDEGSYVAVGYTVTEGSLPYVEAWDNKPPLLHLAFAAAMAIAPSVPMGVAALGIASVWLGSMVLATLTWRLTGRFASAALAGLLYTMFTLNAQGHVTKAEFLLVVPVVGGLLAALCVVGQPWRAGTNAGGAAASRDVFLSAVAGIAFGVAMLVKPVVFTEGVLAGLLVTVVPWFGGNRGSRAFLLALARGAAFSTGVFVPLLITILIYAWAGAWPVFVDAVFQANFRRVEQESFQWTRMINFLRANITGNYRQTMLWIGVAVGVITLVCGSVDARQRGCVAFGLAWLVAALVGVCSMKTFFDHAFYQMLPPLCMLTGTALDRVVAAGSSLSRRFEHAAVVAVLLLPQLHYLANLVKENLAVSDPAAQLVEELQVLTDPDDVIYLPFGPTMAYAMTETRMPSRFASFQHFIWWSEWSGFTGIDADREFEQIQAQQPQVVVTTTWEREHTPPALPDALRRERLRQWLETDYVLSSVVGPYEVFKVADDIEGIAKQ